MRLGLSGVTFACSSAKDGVWTWKGQMTRMRGRPTWSEGGVQDYSVGLVWSMDLWIVYAAWVV